MDSIDLTQPQPTANASLAQCRRRAGLIAASFPSLATAAGGAMMGVRGSVLIGDQSEAPLVAAGASCETAEHDKRCFLETIEAAGLVEDAQE